MTRIAYFINSLEGGGAAFPTPMILGALRNLGADVRLFALTRRDGRAIPALEAAGIDYIVRDGGESDHRAAKAWMVEQARGWQATHAITSLSRATALGLWAARDLGIPIASWQHAAFLKPLNLAALRLLQRRARFWMTDSDAVAQWTQARIGVGADRIAVWPMFAAAPDLPRADAWRDGETLRLGSLGRLHPVKGYAELIEALAILRRDGFRPPVPFRVEIGGDGSQRDALIAQARTAGVDQFDLLGFVDDPQQFLTKQHLYLQPSRSEGFCIAAHEAMAIGLPIIASGVGQMAYTITPGEHGLLVPPRDPKALADALQSLLSAPDRLAAMGDAARAHIAATYSVARFDAAAERVFRRLTAPAG